jgi:hypothetical protein
MCKKSNIENRKLYWYIWGGVTQGDEEAVEQYMKEWGVDENTLIQQAGMLYENFKTSP